MLWFLQPVGMYRPPSGSLLEECVASIAFRVQATLPFASCLWRFVIRGREWTGMWSWRPMRLWDKVPLRATLRGRSTVWQVQRASWRSIVYMDDLIDIGLGIVHLPRARHSAFLCMSARTPCASLATVGGLEVARFEFGYGRPCRARALGSPEDLGIWGSEDRSDVDADCVRTGVLGLDNYSNWLNKVP
jgi:hypothetical protein